MARAAAALAAVFLIVYLPDVGHGFIQDDFRWIVESRVGSAADVLGLFTTNIGFYRPVVYLTFSVDQALWGTDALGYGVTNVALCLAAAGVLFLLGRRLQLPAAAALAAAAVWLFNFHGVNMALLWLSGRTGLLVSLFSLLTAYAMLGGRPLAAGILALLAMLSKEEAVALPALFAVFYLASERRLRTVVRTVPLWAALAVYLILRLQSGAFWPDDAPSYYRFSLSPAGVARNVLEYADRAGTVFAVVVIACVVAARVRWTDVTAGERRVLGFAALWIAASYALTVFLPVRSSLYALLPSIGSALVAGVAAAAAQRRQPRRFRAAAIALMLAVVVLIPVYRARNVRWVRLAELSERVIDTLRSDLGGRSTGHVVLIDDPAQRFNLAATFGSHLPEAIRFRVDRDWSGEIVQPGDGPVRAGDAIYRLAGGAIAPVDTTIRAD